MSWTNKIYQNLTYKQMERYGRVFSTVATDALALKHQATSTHIADSSLTVLD